MNKISDGLQQYTHTITYGEKSYILAFNLNVIAQIQAKYGTLNKWMQLIELGDGTETSVADLLYGLTEMINEGLAIEAEQTGAPEPPPLSIRQVGRIISAVGIGQTAEIMEQTITSALPEQPKNE